LLHVSFQGFLRSTCLRCYLGFQSPPARTITPYLARWLIERAPFCHRLQASLYAAAAKAPLFLVVTSQQSHTLRGSTQTLSVPYLGLGLFDPAVVLYLLRSFLISFLLPSPDLADGLVLPSSVKILGPRSVFSLERTNERTNRLHPWTNLLAFRPLQPEHVVGRRSLEKNVGNQSGRKLLPLYQGTHQSA